MSLQYFAFGIMYFHYDIYFTEQNFIVHAGYLSIYN